MKYKLLVVDDEEMLTSLLYQYFGDNGYIVYTANESEKALKLLEVKPDLILLDVNIPGTDGMVFCQRIREHVTCPILFLTARVTEHDKIRGLKCGGDDYITKPFSLPELKARVEAHLRRDARNKNSSHILVSENLIVDVSKRLVTWGDVNINFSKREFEIIEFLLMNENQVFDKDKIYEEIWGYEAEGNSSVIKEHIRSIRTKLLDATGNSYIQTVWGMGYKWEK